MPAAFFTDRSYEKLCHGNEYLKRVKYLIRFEEVAFFLFSIFLFSLLDFRWWWFPALLLVPDIGMSGYVVNSKVGAVIYNIVHHRAIALFIYLMGAMVHADILQLAGVILFAHSSLDRVFDYGLKYTDGFKHTHVG